MWKSTSATSKRNLTRQACFNILVPQPVNLGMAQAGTLPNELVASHSNAGIAAPGPDKPTTSGCHRWTPTIKCSVMTRLAH